MGLLHNDSSFLMTDRIDFYAFLSGLTAHELIEKLLHTILPDDAALMQLGELRFL